MVKKLNYSILQWTIFHVESLKDLADCTCNMDEAKKPLLDLGNTGQSLIWKSKRKAAE